MICANMIKVGVKLKEKTQKTWDHTNWRCGGYRGLRTMLNCKTRALPTTYLGLPLDTCLKGEMFY